MLWGGVDVELWSGHHLPPSFTWNTFKMATENHAQSGFWLWRFTSVGNTTSGVTYATSGWLWEIEKAFSGWLNPRLIVLWRQCLHSKVATSSYRVLGSMGEKTKQNKKLIIHTRKNVFNYLCFFFTPSFAQNTVSSSILFIVPFQYILFA